MSTQRAAWRTHAPLAVLGTGMALPGAGISSADLIARIKQRFGFARSSTARLLAERMGIASRHICREFAAAAESALPDCSNPELAAQAVRQALDDAGLGVADIDYLIAHTSTPQTQLPPSVGYVADLLGYDGPYVELRQACTGFANGLMIANGLLTSGTCKVVVIVGSETGSLFFDPTMLDENPDQIVNLMQMGDGAGAIVLGPAQASPAPLITAAWFGTTERDLAPGIKLDTGARHFSHNFARITRTGPALFEAGVEMIAALGLRLDEIDRIIPHQASGRIGEQLAQGFKLPPDRLFVNADRLGNTGSAAIWLAFAEIRQAGLARGMRIATLGAESSKYMFGGFIYEHR